MKVFSPHRFFVLGLTLLLLLLVAPFSHSLSPVRTTFSSSHDVGLTAKTSLIKHPSWIARPEATIKTDFSLTRRIRHQPLFAATATTSSSIGNNEPFEIMVDLPPTGSGIQASMRILPVLSVPSTLVIVRYKIPFGLDVAPKKGYAVCTKDGNGGEKSNDILRYTSQWTLGIPRNADDFAATAASFAGSGLSWQCNMFDVCKAKVWEQVVQALTSNVADKTDEVVLIFERALDGIPPELQ
jgi:hypothetical protein